MSPERVTRALIAWNVGTLLYVALAIVMMVRSSDSRIRQRARLQDEGQVVILVLVIVAVLASLAAIAGQLTLAKAMHGAPGMAHIALAGTTVVSSWAFIQGRDRQQPREPDGQPDHAGAGHRGRHLRRRPAQPRHAL